MLTNYFQNEMFWQSIYTLCNGQLIIQMKLEDFDYNNAGFGLMLINLFTQQLNGNYKFINDDGLRYVLNFEV